MLECAVDTELPLDKLKLYHAHAKLNAGSADAHLQQQQDEQPFTQQDGMDGRQQNGQQFRQHDGQRDVQQKAGVLPDGRQEDAQDARVDIQTNGAGQSISLTSVLAATA